MNLFQTDAKTTKFIESGLYFDMKNTNSDQEVFFSEYKLGLEFDSSSKISTNFNFYLTFLILANECKFYSGWFFSNVKNLNDVKVKMTSSEWNFYSTWLSCNSIVVMVTPNKILLTKIDLGLPKNTRKSYQPQIFNENQTGIILKRHPRKKMKHRIPDSC